MSMLEEVSDRGLGWPLGIGLVVAAVSAGPQIVKAGKPLIKGAIKAYLAVEGKAKEAVAEAGEHLQDLYAEAKHEFEESEKMHSSSEEQTEEPKSAAEGEKPSRSKKEKQEEEEEK